MVLVVIDGLDASGKSTQALKLIDYLRKRGKSVCVRFHPSDDNLLGIKAKKFLYLRGKSAHFAAALFYMLDVIRSILLYSWRKYDYVIFVRYLIGTAYLPSPLSTIAYNFFVSIVPTSDYMFFLDISPRRAYLRLQQTRQKLEMFESLTELKVVRMRALSFTARGKWTIINVEKPIQDVEKEILGTLLG